MTTRAAAGPAAGRDRPPWYRPFSVLDELNCYFDSPAEPNNVQLEVWLDGHLRPERLRAAVAAVLAAVPEASARRAAVAWWRARYAWELPPEADIDPVSVTTWRSDAELDEARTRFLAAAPEPGRSPPFRLLLAQGPGHDSLILNAHHAAFDGRSCVRLLSLIANRYSGGEPRESPDPAGAAGPHPEPRQSAGPRSAARPPLPLRHAARIAPQHAPEHAPQHAPGRGARGAPGYGFTMLGWPGIPVAPPSAGEARVTVNDLLITALIQTVTRWNAARHGRPGQVRISMPIDTRAAGHDHELGNLTRLCTVSADPRPGAGLTATVARQTRQAKSTPGPAVSPLQAAVARTPLPIPVKRALIRLALRSLGGIGCDTSLLSNLGNVTDPPAFGMLSPTRMWFSTSAHMPRGLSVGAITVGGRLHLCFRYRNALFDDAAGREFAAEYAAALTALTAAEAGR
jgi:NRPS condensation-like uncharacterized protein